MIKLTKSLTAWQRQNFEAVLKQEIEQLATECLPLQEGLTQSSHVSGDRFQVMILAVSDEAKRIRVRAGIFYNGVIAGCSCADDPTPDDVRPEYCEVEFEIDKVTSGTSVRLLSA